MNSLLDSASTGQVSTTAQDEEITFKLQLNCTARKTMKIQTLRLRPFSPLVQDIKKAIEDEFSIPTCVQTLRYQYLKLPDEGSLLDVCRHVRSGDMLTVDYSCEADVKKINEIIGWIQEVSTAMEKEKNLPFNLRTDTDAVIHEGARKNYDIVLALEIFDWLDAKAYVNKIYFENCGGLREVISLYETILALDWGDMSQTYRYIETFCSHAFANFGETLYFRRVLIQHDAMRMAVESMLRVNMEIQGTAVIEELDPRWGDEYSLYALKRIRENSLHTICNFSELPECQVSIASSSPVIHQALCLSLSDSYHFSIPVLVAEMFLCLAHNPGTHPHLAKPYVVQTLNAVCTKWETSDCSSRRERLLLAALRCFTLMVFSQVAVVSAHLLPVKFIQPITESTRAFLSTATPSEIIKYEEDQVCVWATLLPYLKLFYIPRGSPSSSSPSHDRSVASSTEDRNNSCFETLEERQEVRACSAGGINMQLGDSPSLDCSLEGSLEKERSKCCSMADDSSTKDMDSGFSTCHDSTMDIENSSPQPNSPSPIPESAESIDVHSLQSCSLEMVLYFLHTKVARECHCKVLTEEGLVDFVTCLPWHVDAASRTKAKELVSELSGHIKLQPPRLSNLARAVLAKMYFGLEKVVSVDSPVELARELLNVS